MPPIERDKGEEIPSFSQLCVFDLDHTLLTINTSYEFAWFLYKKKHLSTLQMVSALRYKMAFQLGKLSVKTLHHTVFDTMLKGFSLSFLQEMAVEFMQAFPFPLVYSPAHAALRLSHHLGHYIVILSSSPFFLVDPLARLWKAHLGIGTTYEVDKEGRVSHISQLVGGEEKASFVEKLASKLNVAKKDIIAYTDSYDDLPLLLAAGRPIVVRPDKKLLAVAKQKQWSVI